MELNIIITEVYNIAAICDGDEILQVQSKM